MLNLLKALKSNVNFKAKIVEIDNLVFKFHYRITFWLLMIATVLVCSQEYIGEHIRCLHSDPSDDKKKLEHVIDRFCFFMSTYTVVKHLNKSVSEREIAHPGVGPNNSEDDKIVHAYYQWVPFFLFFQAWCFYIPHLIWRLCEENRIKGLVDGFRFLDYFDKTKKKKMLKKVKSALDERMYSYRDWTWLIIFCECLNFINLILQIYLTNVFLGGQFMSLGPKVYWDYDKDNYNPLDVVFPKVTKCTFRKYGPTGIMQFHDVMCVMALNIINEKIYVMLWFWYTILFAVTLGGLCWRLTTFVLHSSYVFKKWTVIRKCKDVPNADLQYLATKYTFSEWTFLRYMLKNMEWIMIRDLFENISEHEKPEEMIELYEEPDEILEVEPLVIVPQTSFGDVRPRNINREVFAITSQHKVPEEKKNLPESDDSSTSLPEIRDVNRKISHGSGFSSIRSISSEGKTKTDIEPEEKKNLPESEYLSTSPSEFREVNPKISHGSGFSSIRSISSEGKTQTDIEPEEKKNLPESEYLSTSPSEFREVNPKISHGSGFSSIRSISSEGKTKTDIEPEEKKNLPQSEDSSTSPSEIRDVNRKINHDSVSSSSSSGSSEGEQELTSQTGRRGCMDFYKMPISLRA